jgi:hypothetical protein
MDNGTRWKTPKGEWDPLRVSFVSWRTPGVPCIWLEQGRDTTDLVTSVWATLSATSLMRHLWAFICEDG